MSENLVPANYESWMDKPSKYSYITAEPDGSLRLDPDNVRGTRECSIRWVNLKPGDTIRASVMIRTSDFNSKDIAAGGRIVIDFYGSYVEGTQKVRIVDALPRDYAWINNEWYSGLKASYQTWVHPIDNDGSHFPIIPRSQFNVPFGKGWTYAYLSATVPNKEFVFVDGHPNTKIIGAIVGLDARGISEGQVWFQNAEIYVNEGTAPPPPPLEPMTVEISAGPNGTTEPTGTITITENTAIHAIANEYYHFDIWRITGLGAIGASYDNPYIAEYSPKRKITLAAEFARDRYPGKTLMARTIGPLGVPMCLLYRMWLLREKYIRKEVHKRLHPII